MKTVFSTAEVHPRDRFDHWQNVICRTIAEQDARPTFRESFRAELQAGVLAEIMVILFETAPMTLWRRPHHIAQADADELFMCRQFDGLVSLEQEGRELVLEPGDITLLDPRLPYAGKFSGESRILILKIPRRLLEARLGKTREMAARALKPAVAEHSFVSTFLAMLPAHTDWLGSAAQEMVANQALDLIAVSLAKAIDGGRPRASSARSLTLMQVHAAIEARLTDPALDAATVAAAAGVSVRYANAVLAEESMSIMRLIQAKRLERCRRALEDPAQACRTVSDIAYGWGFSDMTHFGRKFRAAYGVLPREYRRLMAAA